MQGDSGFMLVRGGEIVFKSPVLQHFFDCPFQVRVVICRRSQHGLPPNLHAPLHMLGSLQF